MYFRLKTFLLSLMLVFVFVPGVYAIDLGTNRVDRAAGQAGYAAATETTFAENVGRAIRILLSLLGVIFTVLIIYAGYLWMTAAGNDEAVSKAKSIISTSIIGLIILLMAYSITNFVVTRVMEGALTSTSTSP